MSTSDHPPTHVLHPIDCPEWQVWAVRISRIIARAWTDDAYKARLIADPASALDDAGLAVPAGLSVVVVEGATAWTLSGSALTGAARFELPLPPKPDIDQVMKAWAEGEEGHPPIVSAEGGVAFGGVPAGADPAEARRVAEARRIAEGRRLGDYRRLTEGRRLAQEADEPMAEAAEGRRLAEARRLTEGRRLAEGRRATEDDGAPAPSEARRLADARRLVEDAPGVDASEGRRLTEGRRVADDAASPEDPTKPSGAGGGPKPE